MGDKIWKPKRVPDLEYLITTELVAAAPLTRSGCNRSHR
jgi:hypothetical protein